MVEATSEGMGAEVGWFCLPRETSRNKIEQCKEDGYDTVSLVLIEELFSRHGAIDTMWILGFGEKLSEPFPDPMKDKSWTGEGMVTRKFK